MPSERRDIMIHFFERLIENSIVKLILSTVGSILTFLFGGFGTILSSFVALLALDFITGILKAIKNKELSSWAGREGGKKIITYIVVIAFANLLERVGLVGIRSFTILWASITEGISIIENLDVLGFPFPDFIKEKLLQAKEKKFGGN